MPAESQATLTTTALYFADGVRRTPSSRIQATRRISPSVQIGARGGIARSVQDGVIRPITLCEDQKAAFFDRALAAVIQVPHVA
ncbi:MAG: hypothetical protein HOY76_04305, partial [Streptomyces sp.]|nr:hypothetical protein [Streptomyces sp.]